jgi:hypothetical protein
MNLRLLLLLALLPIAAAAAKPDTGDAALVKICQGELEPRLFSGDARGEAFIAAEQVEHHGERVVVHLDLASGEGRRVSGACVFRGGKLFDVK